MPEMAAASVHAVDVLGVEEMRTANRLGKGGVVAWNCNDVNVVGHQAIAKNIKAKPLGLLFEEFEINRPVVVDKENVLPIITTLGNMMSNILQNYSANLSIITNIADYRTMSKKNR